MWDVEVTFDGGLELYSSPGFEDRVAKSIGQEGTLALVKGQCLLWLDITADTREEAYRKAGELTAKLGLKCKTKVEGCAIL